MVANSSEEFEEEEEKWAQWFCGLPGNEFFCEINPAYIEDSFNLYGLRAMVPNYQDALNIILDLTDIPYDDDVPSCAVELYGLIHARYIITSHGLDAMLKKYREAEFGYCPRALCDGQPVVPAGMYDEPRKAEMKVYCPKCRDLYTPAIDFESATIDGAYFGSTFPHLFFLTYSNLEPAPSTHLYVPRVFGYKIHRKGPNRQRLATTAKAIENGDDTQGQRRLSTKKDQDEAAAKQKHTSDTRGKKRVKQNE
ncbi:casein kinase II subunit beta [Thraustotheca clavata]|uniref:Casein kinase II subunit beta n=1 Tax=Thraustotheca clavata TaxID=74557 RepID=A0A1W0AB01_9STRA|nr:casein kinase II subunit beta [Thraustotheca clavata]